MVLVSLMDKLCQQLDGGRLALLLLLDFIVSFNTVDHLTKLETVG